MQQDDDVRKILERNRNKKVNKVDYNANVPTNTNVGMFDVNAVDNNANFNTVVDAAVVATAGGNRVNTKDELVSRYRESGVRYNPNTSTGADLDFYNAANQRWYQQVGSFLVRTVGSELIIGGVKSIFDAFGALAHEVGLDDDYSNPVSDFLEKGQDWINNDVAPIYRDPTKTDVTSGALGDFGWWAENATSVVSSLAMLIGTKGVGMIGKVGLNALKTVGKIGGKAARATRVGSTIGRGVKKAQNWTHKMATENKVAQLKPIAATRDFVYNPAVREIASDMGKAAKEGIIMRAMENYQEAHQVYQDMYADALESLNGMTEEEYADFISRNKETIGDEVDINDKDAVAKHIAKKSADRTFALDWMNATFDFIQILALRNKFKGQGKVQQSALARQREKFARKHAGEYKTDVEFEKLWKARSKKTKALDWAKRRTIDGGLAVKAQLGEGVEEAINYIASEEGMNVGKTILGTEDANYSNDRLFSYIKSPQLWESAFWGVAGGVIFQAGGSKYNQIENRVNAGKRQKELDKRKAKTGEEVVKPKWTEMWEMPDEKRNKEEFRKRMSTIEKYSKIFSKLNAHQDPSTEEVKSISPEEEAVLRARYEEQYAKDLMFDALDAGRFDVVKGFIEDENVIQSLVNQKIFDSAEEAKAFSKRVSDIMTSAKEEYVKEGVQLNKMAAHLNAKRFNNEKIDPEILQLIARENIANRDIAKACQTSMDLLDKQIAEQEARMRESNPDFDGLRFRDNIKLKHYTQTLGMLQAAKRQLEHGPNKDSIVNQIEIDKLNKQIKETKEKIKNLNPENALTNLLVAIRDAAGTELEEVREPDGTTSTRLKSGNTVEFNAIDEAIKTRNKETLAKIDSELADLTDNVFDQVDVVDDEVMKLFGQNPNVDREANNELREKSEELWSLYNDRASAEISRNEYQSSVINTDDELAKEVNNKYNYISELRRNAINQAYKELTSVIDEDRKKYIKEGYDQETALRKAAQKLLESIKDRHDGVGRKNLNEKVNSALDVLHFESDNNAELYKYIDDAVRRYVDIEIAKIRSGNTVIVDDSEEKEEQLNAEIESIRKILNKQWKDKNYNIKVEKYDDGRRKGYNITITDKNDNELLIIEQGYGNGICLKLGKDGKTFMSTLYNNNFVFCSEGVSLLDDYNIYQDIIPLNIDNDDFSEHLSQMDKPLTLQKLLYSFDATKSDDMWGYFIIEPIKSDNNNENANNDTDNSDTESDETIEGLGNNNENENTEEESNPEPEHEPEPEPQQEDTTSPVEENTTNQDEPAQKPSNLPTGDESNQPVEDNSQLSPEPIPDPIVNTSNEPVTKTLYQQLDDDIVQLYGDPKAYEDDNMDTINMSYVRAKLIEKYANGNENADVVKDIDKKLEYYEKVFEKDGTNVVYNAIKSSFIKEGQSKEEYEKIMHESYDKLIQAFLSKRGEHFVNGVAYVNMEALMRYCIEVTNDTQSADLLFENMLRYMLSSDKYRVTNKYPNMALNDSKIPKDVRKVELSKTTKSYSTGLKFLMDYYKRTNKTAELRRLEQVLDRINVGDSVSYKLVNENNKTFISFEVDGVSIGKLPAPRIEKTSEGKYIYKQVNDGWVTDIEFTENGGYISKLEFLFEKIASNSNNDPEYEELYNIALRYTYSKNDKEREDCIKQFGELSIIKNLENYGYIDPSATSEELISGLSKILNYVHSSSIETEGTNREYKAESVQNWFNGNVAPSFAMVVDLTRHPNIPFVIDNIKEGELIQATENPLTEPDKLETPISGLTEDNRKKASVVLIDKNDSSKVLSAGIENSDKVISRAVPGQTFIAIPTRNGKKMWISAFPQPISGKGSGSLGPQAKAIMHDISSELVRICTDKEKSVEDRGKELRTFLGNLVNGSDNTTTLLTNAKDKMFIVAPIVDKQNPTKINGFSIIYGDKNNKHYLNVYTNKSHIGWKLDNGNARYGVQYDVDGNVVVDNYRELGKTIANALIGNTTFNIGYNFVKSDKDKSIPLNGFCRRNPADGKFIIKIPNQNEYTFDSFNDFVISQNLVKINAKVENGSNFRRRSESGYNDFDLTIKANMMTGNNTTNPAQQSSSNSTNPTSTNPKVQQIIDEYKKVEDRGTKALAILQSDKTDKAYNIAKLLLNVSDGDNSLLKFLLPQRIRLISKNIGRNAVTAVNGAGTIKTPDGETIKVEDKEVVIGNELLDLLLGDAANLSTQEEFVRKLMHERLHILLHSDNNSQYIERLRDIFDEFEASNPDGDIAKYLYTAKKYRNENGSINEEGLEEFLVETLTSKELATYLNNIITTNPNTNQKESVLQKIMKFLSKLMGINITKGSLYEKEFNLLGEAFSESTTKIEPEVNTNIQSQNTNILENATVIWAHPTQGKTSMVNSGRTDVIDFDTEYTPRLAELLGEPTDIEKKELSKKYTFSKNPTLMHNYYAALDVVFNEAKERAKLEGKKLLVSDMQFLRFRQGEIDAFVTKSKEKFIEDLEKRGDNSETAENWKNNIDRLINTADQNKVVRTDEYLGNLIPEPIEENTPVVDINQQIDDELNDATNSIFESTINESQENYTSEMQEIKAKAIADGTFMKAPNGNPTNLTERQWLQVRTKNFINWFGDWLNVNKFNVSAIDTSKVDIKFEPKPWKTDKSRVNDTIQLYIKGHPEKGYFELVKDEEFGQFSVHFKTSKEGAKYNAENVEYTTKEERKILFEELVKAIPEGATVSTWGELSEDGVRGLKNVGRNMTKIGERVVHLKSKDNIKPEIKIPIYQKGEGVSKVVDENGEPLVVYHATKAKFNTFDSSFAGTGSGNTFNTNGVFYFAAHKETALDTFHTKTKEDRDAYNVMEVFLNLKEPNVLKLEDFNKTWFDKNKFEQIKKGDGIIGVPEETPEQVYERKLKEYNEKEKNGTLSMFDRKPKSPEQFMEEQQDTIYVAFNPNQIKSATDNNGEFSRDNDNIRNSSIRETREILDEEHNKYLSESEYKYLLKDLRLDRSKFENFIFNFSNNILNVNPRYKVNEKSDSFVYRNALYPNTLYSNDLEIFMKKLFGYNIMFDISTSKEKILASVDKELENWEEKLTDIINKPFDISDIHKKRAEIRNEIKILQQLLNRNLDTSTFSEEELDTLHNVPFRFKQSKQKAGYRIQTLKKELKSLDEEQERRVYVYRAKTLAAKNRFLALQIIPDLKDIIKKRIILELESRSISDKNYKENIEPYKELAKRIWEATSPRASERGTLFNNEKQEDISYDKLTDIVVEKNPEYKYLMQLFKMANPEIKVVIGGKAEYIMNGGIEGTVPGKFRPRTNTVYLTSSADVHTVIHELAHSATWYGLTGNEEDSKPLEESINKFMDYIRNYIAEHKLNPSLFTKVESEYFKTVFQPTIYGFTNASEFVAELFSNPTFRDMLEFIPPMEHKEFNSLLQEFWHELIGMLNRIFGRNIDKNALQQAEKLGYASLILQQQHIDNIYKQLNSINENNVQPLVQNYKQKITSLNSFLQNFPLSLQSEILNDVEDGEIGLSCSL